MFTFFLYNFCGTQVAWPKYICGQLRLKNLYTNPKIVLVCVCKRHVSVWFSYNPRSYWVLVHSGTLPHKYKVVIQEPSVKCCYRSGNLFIDKYRSSPYNLVGKHVDRRLVGKMTYYWAVNLQQEFLKHIITWQKATSNAKIPHSQELFTFLWTYTFQVWARNNVPCCDLQLVVQ